MESLDQQTITTSEVVQKATLAKQAAPRLSLLTTEQKIPPCS